MCFSPYLRIGFGGWGSPNVVVHNPLMQFYALYSSEIEVFKTYLLTS